MGTCVFFGRNCLVLDFSFLLMAVCPVLGLPSPGSGVSLVGTLIFRSHLISKLLCLEGIPEPFLLEFHTAQSGTYKNLGYLLNFIAGALRGRDKGIKSYSAVSLPMAGKDSEVQSVYCEFSCVYRHFTRAFPFMPCGRNKCQGE